MSSHVEPWESDIEEEEGQEELLTSLGLASCISISMRFRGRSGTIANAAISPGGANDLDAHTAFAVISFAIR
jgi:hypothetical protein